MRLWRTSAIIQFIFFTFISNKFPFQVNWSTDMYCVNVYTLQGPAHRLEIAGPEYDSHQSAMKLSELSTDDEDHVHSHMKQYEKKIDRLMNEVGHLKSEVHVKTI